MQKLVAPRDGLSCRQRRAAWLRELRLHQARQLLEAGGFGKVAKVAAAVGFVSVKHFSNLYAERFGRRPSDYRTPKN